MKEEQYLNAWKSSLSGNKARTKKQAWARSIEPGGGGAILTREMVDDALLRACVARMLRNGFAACDIAELLSEPKKKIQYIARLLRDQSQAAA